MVAERAGLYEELAATGDFRRGSVSVNYRRCGKANCACAAPEHPGHGPRMLWTRTGPGGKSRGRQLAALEVEKVRAELDAYSRFASLTAAIVEVNEAICEARPVTAATAAAAGSPPGVGSLQDPAATDGEKGAPKPDPGRLYH
ncbi:hypothetical protein CVV68_01015 [Arthrobacter livingstonensis]|uniref:DUF6788 domain-containing protein n=2 Tax=Arthrobacter livingstonensis TaxID=670078 RepID=A0A2V5LP30_9MICC|nr:hypothetical protein CVV68_01015 [Arthrobacter livingstonensis]